MTARLSRHFVTVGQRHVHYRRAGDGPPVLLLHESPLSSVSLADLTSRLGSRFAAIAFDTPGYGSSDALATERPEIPEYADAVAETMDALGLDRACIYGAHTGALIALELAVRHPERVAAAVFDGLPIFTEEERAELLETYLPLFGTEIHGGHLARLWTRYRDQHLFFPWYERKLSARLDIDMPDAEHLHEGVMDLLQAGDGYRVAYAAAFRHITTPVIQDLTVPTAIIAREDDLLAPQLERLPPLPASCTATLLDRDRDAWAEWIADFCATHSPSGATAPAPAPAPVGGRITRDYVRAADDRELLVRQRTDETDRPLVLLHGTPDSSRLLEGLMAELAARGPVVALDLPGNGHSEPLATEEPTVAEYADAVAEALDALGHDRPDVYGRGTGAAVAIELALRHPDRIGALVLDEVHLLDQAQREEILAHYALTFEPEWDGSHLLRAWHFVRDHTLFDPWYDRTRTGIRWIDPVDEHLVHERVVELLKSGSGYEALARAGYTYPVADRLRALATPTLLCADDDTDDDSAVARATADALSATLRRRPETIAGRASVITDFLEATRAGA